MIDRGKTLRTMILVSAALLGVAVCVYLVTTTQRAESPLIGAVTPPVAGMESANAEAESVRETRASSVVQRSPVADEPSSGVPTVAGTDVLLVVLEGISTEDAKLATVKLTAIDTREKRTAEIQDSWPCQGTTSEINLDPYFAAVAERHTGLSVDELEVEVDHPNRLREITRVSLRRGMEPVNGKTVHEVRVRLVRAEYWPEFTLAVRDAHTREDLEDIELRFIPGATTSMWGRNTPSTRFADRLKSPITLMGGRDVEEPGAGVAHLAVRPAAGESPRLVKLAYATRPHFGFVVSARAPGYAWGSIVLDFSENDERELLLKPGSAIDVQLTNVQRERYRELEVNPMLCVYRKNGDENVHFAPLDETLESEGMRLSALKPGDYRVTVELGGGSWSKRPVLAREEFSLPAGEMQKLVLTLTDPPALPERVTLSGVVSFPAFDGVEEVRLKLYKANWRGGAADVELSLAEMVRVSGALPTWSFQLEDIPVGTCQIHLLPFLKNWMIDVPSGGREDVALIVPELAEVLVETVDERTGERIPLEQLRYGYREELEGQMYFLWSTGARPTLDFEGEPGRFRFWMAPGSAYVRTWGIPADLGYASRHKDMELVPGLQSARIELAAPCRIRFDIRIDGTAPELSDGIWEWVHYGTLESIYAVDHAGRSRGRVGKQTTEVSAPGLYEISFDGLTKDRFHPIPPRLVDVRAGETTEVIVELGRK